MTAPAPRWSYETNTLRLSILQAGKNAAFDDRQKLTYSYDNNGNVTSLTDAINAGQKQRFYYDYLNRLVLAMTGSSICYATIRENLKTPKAGLGIIGLMLAAPTQG
jgi:YD repeat-containing protein